MESPHVLREMCATLPSNPEIATIFNSRSGWWEVWREAFGLAWGHQSDASLEKFATRAIHSGRPSSLGSLLICFAFSTGEHDRYLAPVERWASDSAFSVLFNLAAHGSSIARRTHFCSWREFTGPIGARKAALLDEQIDKVTSQLPPDYLSMGQISACREVKEQSARLYRLMQIHQLKTFLYLPLFLQHCETEQRQEQHHYNSQRHGARFSRVACVDNARSLLDSFLALHNIDPPWRSIQPSGLRG
ncbi:fungal specific transcription factor domain-containing protein [Aspergillus affinis]|uniref:fungal specific transcription factor domain-containing protein n=1 Tax=Aspergillus affinis TaxID=1070780 RepID=UPI0022FE9476|nr:uncharacterized protein KD926_000877 [Aspergillus affinis]KAI9037091.1 hypothetical protein KD926_000877 [Aspergillus affinis]